MFASENQRKYLLLGPSGVGKSTLCNALLSGKVDIDSLKRPAEVSNRAVGVTGNIYNYVGDNTLVITDTIGFDDNRFDPQTLAGELHGIIKGADIGFSKIILCLRLGRISANSRVFLELLNSIFEKPETHTILYVSGCEDGTTVEQFLEVNESDEDIGSWLTKLKEENLRNKSAFKNIITGTMMTHRNQEKDAAMYHKLRKETMDEIVKSMEVDIGVIKAKQNVLEEIRRFLRWLFIDYWKRPSIFSTLSSTIVEMWTKSKDIAIVYHYGDCGICLDGESTDPWGMIKCKHKFHLGCMKGIPNLICPYCREPFSVKEIEELP